MTEIINLNSKRPPSVYRIVITHYPDGSRELFLNESKDDKHSRDSVNESFRIFSGADEEIRRLKEYCDMIDKECTNLREALAAALEIGYEDNEWQNMAREILKEK